MAVAEVSEGPHCEVTRSLVPSPQRACDVLSSTTSQIYLSLVFRSYSECFDEENALASAVIQLQKVQPQLERICTCVHKMEDPAPPSLGVQRHL